MNSSVLKSGGPVVHRSVSPPPRMKTQQQSRAEGNYKEEQSDLMTQLCFRTTTTNFPTHAFSNNASTQHPIHSSAYDYSSTNNVPQSNQTNVLIERERMNFIAQLRKKDFELREAQIELDAQKQQFQREKRHLEKTLYSDKDRKVDEIRDSYEEKCIELEAKLNLEYFWLVFSNRT